MHPYIRYVPRGGRVAEYGCGAGPVLTALARRYRQLVGADIPHLLFHYARWTFRADRFVTMVGIAPDDDAPLPGLYDTIFCLEVFATSLRDRSEALRFLLDHFDVVQGRVTVSDEHVPTSVVRKR